jgi:zinc and cadmium transporter
MTLLSIVAATLACGIGSVWLAAALLSATASADARASGADAGLPQQRGAQSLLSLAAGALLATAFMHLLPEAFESQASAHELFATLLIGVVFFFLLDKAELWHHGHEHHAHHDHHEGGHDAAHAHGHNHAHAHGAPARAGGWSILTGDSVHCFGDGILIASAFIADWRLGVVAALAVLAHEVPHHMGDLVVLRQTSARPALAVLKVSMAGAVTAIGGLTGFFLVEQLQDYLPYFLVVASSSFVYVALADLIPQLQRHLTARQTAVQIAWLAVGIALVTLISGLAHGH